MTDDEGAGAPVEKRLADRLALGRAIRRDAERMVIRRGILAEAAAWSAARSPDLNEEERLYREAVAHRISRMFALIGIENRH
jgi:hypothetical protein